MTADHPFAGYIRHLARPTHGRSLTEDQACSAFGMIMADQVEPAQLGAFLCLLREKSETPAEVAGFVRAVRPTLAVPADRPSVDVDWPAYAGKRRRPAWFLLAALLLAQSGVRILMHGEDEPASGRVFAAEGLGALGLPVADGMADAVRQLAARNFAYLPLRHLSPRLHTLMMLRSVLGVRTPIHTCVRNVNAFAARCLVIGVAHPPYRTLHQTAGIALGEHCLAVFKGDGGEAERRPEKPCDVAGVNPDGGPRLESWPALLEAGGESHGSDASPARLAGLWDGTAPDPAAEAAAVGTAAVVLAALGRADGREQALHMARALWDARKPLDTQAGSAESLPPPAA